MHDTCMALFRRRGHPKRQSGVLVVAKMCVDCQVYFSNSLSKSICWYVCNKFSLEKILAKVAKRSSGLGNSRYWSTSTSIYGNLIVTAQLTYSLTHEMQVS